MSGLRCEAMAHADACDERQLRTPAVPLRKSGLVALALQYALECMLRNASNITG
jgi:hypothetical protein